MHKKILFALLFLGSVFSSSLFSQKIGLRGGMNFGKILIEDQRHIYSRNLDYHKGFHIGPTFEFKIRKNFGIETALLLSTTGYELEDEFYDQGEKHAIDEKMNLYYLNMPIYIKGYMDVERARIFGFAGPYGAWAMGGKVKSLLTAGTQEKEENYDVDIGYKAGNFIENFDYGLSVGAGFVLELLEVAIIYNHGYCNLSTSKINQRNVRNRYLQASLTFHFIN